MTITVGRNSLGNVFVLRDDQVIGEIRPDDGEILLKREVSATLSDDDWLTLMKIGFKPAMFFGDDNIFDKPKAST